MDPTETTLGIWNLIVRFFEMCQEQQYDGYTGPPDVFWWLRK